MEGTCGGAEWDFDFCGGLEGQGGGEQMGHGEGDVSEGGGGRGGGGECQGGGGKMSYGAWGLEDSEWRARLRDIYSELLQPVLLEGRLDDSGTGTGKGAGTGKGKGTGTGKGTGGDSHFIPRTLHNIWLGGSLPERFSKLREGWASRHAGWKLILWDDDAVSAEIADRPLRNSEMYEKAGNLGQRSDILRLELLHRYGGVYVDVDFECIRGLDPLISAIESAGIGFFCGVSNVRFFEVNNGLVGACKAHKLLDECIRSIGDGQRVREEGAGGSLAASLMGHGGDTISLTGPGMLTRCLGSFVSPGGGGVARLVGASPRHPLNTAAALPCGFPGGAGSSLLQLWFFYPLPNSRAAEGLGLTNQEREGLLAMPHVHAAHLWAQTWQRPSASLSQPVEGGRGTTSAPQPCQKDIIWLCNIAARQIESSKSACKGGGDGGGGV